LQSGGRQGQREEATKHMHDFDCTPAATFDRPRQHASFFVVCEDEYRIS
jgi:hypothetical protein